MSIDEPFGGNGEGEERAGDAGHEPGAPEADAPPPLAIPEESELLRRFPEMERVESLPALGRLFGTGLALHGSRDHDEETRSYVTTRFFDVLGIPVFALDAYRFLVVDPFRRLLLGREPLRGATKLRNLAALSAIVLLVAAVLWARHTASPEYRALRTLERADEAAASGEYLAAARYYREVAAGPTRFAPTGAEGLRFLLEDEGIQLSADLAGDLLGMVSDLRRKESWPTEGPGPVDILRGWIDRNRGVDPREILKVTGAVQPLEKEHRAYHGLLEGILEQRVAEAPDDIDAVSRLAATYEALGKRERCEPLLSPHADDLGGREGGRILGEIRAEAGHLDSAQALLWGYCEPGLGQLKRFQEALRDARSRVEQQAVDDLEQHRAPQAFYDEYFASTPDRQNLLVRAYVSRRIEEDLDAAEAQEALLAKASVVDVAMRLAEVMLRRAQSLKGVEARDEQLRRIETLLLSLPGEVRESDPYRLGLGEVYFRVGRAAEGRALFQEVLESNGRSFAVLMGVAGTLRGLGETAEVRRLAEEAYGRAGEDIQKRMAADLRSCVPTDEDDAIAWLRRADGESPSVRARLSTFLGSKAFREGREEEAAMHLRRAIRDHETEVESASSLNNGASEYRTLFAITGDGDSLKRAAEMLERALALKPGDPLLERNLAPCLLQRALLDIVSPSIRVDELRTPLDLYLLAFLCDDEEGLHRLRERLRTDPTLRRALEHYRNVALLAPKDPTPYEEQLSVYTFLKDVEALRGISAQLDRVGPDLDGDAAKRSEPSKESEGSWREATSRRLAGVRERALAAHSEKGDPTFAVATSSLALQGVVDVAWGRDGNADENVRLAEEAHAAAPSGGTAHALISASCLRACLSLSGQDPRFASAWTKARRSVDPQYIVAAALRRGGEVAELVKADPDVARATDLLVSRALRFSTGASWPAYALAAGAGPERAAQAEDLRKRIIEDEAARLALDISRRLWPANAEDAIEMSSLLDLEGKPEEAKRVLLDCAKRGVALPFDPE